MADHPRRELQSEQTLIPEFYALARWHDNGFEPPHLGEFTGAQRRLASPWAVPNRNGWFGGFYGQAVPIRSGKISVTPFYSMEHYRSPAHHSVFSRDTLRRRLSGDYHAHSSSNLVHPVPGPSRDIWGL